MIGSKRTLLAVSCALLLVALFMPVHAINGIRICGINYACGASDGVCPEIYCSAASPACVSDPKCTPLDPDCVNAENSVATCAPATGDEDLDGAANFADATPGYAPGQSCNVCDLATIQAAVPTARAAQCGAAAPGTLGLTWVDGATTSPGSAAALRWDCNGQAAAPNCYYGTCTAPNVWNGVACVPPTAPTITLSVSPLSGTTPVMLTSVAATGNVNAVPATVVIDTDGNTATWEETCNIATVGAFTCTYTAPPPLPIFTNPPAPATHTLTARITDAAAQAALDTETVTVNPPVCIPTPPGGPCTVNSDCCGASICQAGACVSEPAVTYSIIASAYPGGRQYTDGVGFVLGSTVASATNNYYVDYGNSVNYNQGTGFTRTYSYPVRGTYNTFGRISWTGGNPAVSSTSTSAIVPLTVYDPPTTGPLAISAGPYVAGMSYTLTFSGASADPSLSANAFQIDTNGDASVYEAQGSSMPLSAVTGPLAVGTYTFRSRVLDTNGRLVNAGTQTITVGAANAPPTIVTFTEATTTQAWESAQSDFNIRVTDDTPGITISLDFGDGTPAFTDASGPSTVLAYATPAPATPHTYVARAAPYTATLTATDANGVSTTATVSISATGLPCVVGTDTGAPTYTNDPRQCCDGTPAGSFSCAQDIGGGSISCFSRTACFASNSSICAGAPGPYPNSTFVERDTNSITCEQGGPGQSCAYMTWTSAYLGGAAGSCCGDDNPAVGAGNEYVAVKTAVGGVEYLPANPGFGTNDACCSLPNQCYTDATGTGTCHSPDAITGLFTEICGNGQDDNCNGIVDTDGACASNVHGVVRRNDVNGVSLAVGATVKEQNGGAATTDGTGAYAINGLFDPAETYTIYAGMTGYGVQTKTFQVPSWGGDVVVDFDLTPRVCSASCTNAEGYCDRDCIGVGACQPTAAEINTLYSCHPAGQMIGYINGTVVQVSNSSTQIFEVHCCIDPTLYARDAPQVTVESDAETMTKLTRTFGNGLRLVILTWSS